MRGPRKRKNNSASDIQIDEARVIGALNNPKYRYRTVRGIAKETNINPDQVERMLAQNSAQVRKSITKASDGSTLYASKKNVSVAQDFWSAFKALNRAKYG